MVKISDRLKTAASLIREGAVLADVGTDHGYVPIYLLEQKKIKSAIAMDINKGPLERAREHIHLYGMDAYIQTRLSDGVAALEKGEADSILVAGMGGGLVMHILEEGKDICQAAGELILHPAGKAALPAAVQQCAHAERRKLCGLAVFQLELRALGPHNIDEGEPEQQHGA
mgnify:CR=1 FL=1